MKKLMFVLLVAMLASNASAVNLLSNPGFELPLYEEGYYKKTHPTDWTMGGNFYHNNTWDLGGPNEAYHVPVWGEQCAEAGPTHDGSTPGTISQNVALTVEADTEYTLTANALYVSWTGSGPSYVKLHIGWDGGEVVTDPVVDQTQIVDTMVWQEYSLTLDTALYPDAVGQTGLTVMAEVTTDSNRGLAFDNMSLTPEPATMMLLGLGGLLLRRRRR